VRGRRLELAALAAGVLATVVMVAFESTVPRILGVLLMLSFIVLGVFAIATPEYLDADPEDESR
jgi:hypothetical protein